MEEAGQNKTVETETKRQFKAQRGSMKAVGELIT